MAMELIKENIEYEQLLGEQVVDNVVKEEYVIPDVQPDVAKILMLEAKPKITNKEVMQNKIYVEGQIKYNVMYLASGENGNEVYNVIYTKDFSNYLDTNSSRENTSCDVECNVEHINCNIINERKISIEGIIQLKVQSYRRNELSIVKDVDSIEDIQLLKNPSSVDKIVGTVEGELLSKAHIQIPMDKPEIGKILKCEVMIHKNDVKLMEDKLQVETFARVQILYKGLGARELYTLEEDVFVSDEIEFDGVRQYMNGKTEFVVDNIMHDIKEDDLGENRIIDVEAIIKHETKIMHKEEFDMIEDAYSPSKILRMDKKNYELNVILGQNTAETIIKENIELSKEMPKPVEVVMPSGKLLVTDKKIVEDRIIVEGLLNVNVVYKTDDEEKYVAMVSEEIPFSCNIDIPGTKIDMDCMVKVYLESLEAFVEANTIAVKCVAKVYAKVDYKTHKEFLVDILPSEDEVISKKASVTIYVVQDGDTLWKIAKKYCATVESLSKVNELENENIMAGTKLIIPGRAII
jgi:LysM repeat protein